MNQISSRIAKWIIKKLDWKLVITHAFIADWRADGASTLLKILTTQNQKEFPKTGNNTAEHFSERRKNTTMPLQTVQCNV
jgi:hypothetical protein